MIRLQSHFRLRVPGYKFLKHLEMLIQEVSIFGRFSLQTIVSACHTFFLFSIEIKQKRVTLSFEIAIHPIFSPCEPPVYSNQSTFSVSFSLKFRKIGVLELSYDLIPFCTTRKHTRFCSILFLTT